MDAAKEWVRSKAATTGHPLHTEYAKLTELFEERHWHQLTTHLEHMIAAPYWADGTSDELNQLYTQFVCAFAGKLNPLRLALIAVSIAESFTDIPAAVAFMEDVITRVKVSPPAHVVSLCTLAKLHLRSGSGSQCKALLEEAREKLDSFDSADSSVYISYYDASTTYYEKHGPAAEYFKNGLLYLAYTPIESIALARQQELAFSLCVASLVGESVYSFGELLAQPLLNSLENTERAWIVRLVTAFNAGDIGAYEQLQNEFKDQLNAEPALVHNVRLLTEKISVLALMELVFERASEERAIPFSVIAQHTKLANDEVELLVMKALSLKLVRGAIDQVDQVATFSWVQPRVLDLAQVSGLQARLNKWKTKVSTSFLDVERQAQELFV